MSSCQVACEFSLELVRVDRDGCKLRLDRRPLRSVAVYPCSVFFRARGILTVWYLVPGSTGRFVPRAASAARCRYARSQGRLEQLANEADIKVLDFRCQLATCNAKSSMLQDNNPDAPHMNEYIERRERAVLLLIPGTW